MIVNVHQMGLQGCDEETSELYSNYRPARLTDGCPHPDPIVETASLAGVSPPEPKYQHHLQVLCLLHHTFLALAVADLQPDLSRINLFR